MVPLMLASNRPRWRNRFHFFLYISALVFSPTSVWKFPMLWCHHNGVAFLLPFALCLLVVGVPIICLEISLGQFMQRGGPNAWGVVPLFKGISITNMLIIVMKLSTNLNLAAGSAYYLYLILTNQLPTCVTQSTLSRPFSRGVAARNESVPPGVEHTTSTSAEISKRNDTVNHLRPPSFGTSHDTVSSHNMTCQELVSQFWSQDVLETSETITSPGTSVIQIFLATVAVSLVIYTIVVRDIRWSGQIMYILAPIPLVGFLSIIAWTASSGWNLGLGVYYLLTPNFEILSQPETWFACVEITLLTLGVGLNVFQSLASYNKPVTNTIRDSWLICLLAVSTNVFASLSVVGLLGKVKRHDDVDYDPSFVLTSVSGALLGFQHHVILCSLFCALLIIIILSTTVVYAESLVTSLVDLSILKLRRWRVLVVTGTLSVCFLLTIAMSTQGGIYVCRLFERITDGGFLILVVCILECLIIGVVYGGRRFYDNLEAMTGTRPHWWMRFCWTCLSPLILMATLVYQEYSSPLYILELGHSQLADILLISMVVVLLLPVPAVAVWIIYHKDGTCFKKIQSALKPDLKPHQIPIRWRLEGRWVKFTNKL